MRPVLQAMCLRVSCDAQAIEEVQEDDDAMMHMFLTAIHQVAVTYVACFLLAASYPLREVCLDPVSASHKMR